MTNKVSLLLTRDYYHGSTRTIRLWSELQSLLYPQQQQQQQQPLLQAVVLVAVAPIQMALPNTLSRRILSSSTTTTTTTRRLPTPPMPRTTYSIVITEVNSDIMTKLRLWWKNGTVLTTIGFVGLLTLLLDRYLQKRQLLASDPEDFPLNREVMMHEIVVSAQQQRRLLYQQYSTAPALYQCRVIQYYKMGGSHGLYNVQLQDIVEVLDENVGPKQAYHLCRLIRPSSDNDINDQNQSPHPMIYKNENGDIIELGWYPITHLEKYTPPPSNKRSWWKRLLFL